MPNGRPHDHPVTDTVIHGMHPFPPELEDLVRQVHARHPEVFEELGSAPFDWEQGRCIPEAITLMRGIIEDGSDLVKRERWIREYRLATA